jgi:hypothetical protein
MCDTEAPSAIAELGYDEDDVPALVEGAMELRRLLAMAPKDVGAADVAHVPRASMRSRCAAATSGGRARSPRRPRTRRA